MIEHYKTGITDYLSGARERGLPIAVQEIRETLHVSPSQTAPFQQALDALAADGRIVLSNNHTMITLPQPGEFVTGVYHQTMRGFGFISPDRPNIAGDLFIPAADNKDAVTGDTVTARVVLQDKYNSRGGPGKRSMSGRIVEIVRRGTNKLVGTLTREQNRWLVVPDGTVFRAPVHVRDVTAKAASDGDKVVVELLRFPQGDQPAEGVITEVLGPRGDPEVELQSVIRKHDLPQSFPDPVLEQARAAARDYQPEQTLSSGREDLSDLTIATIDPDDARDFDDAISLRVFDIDDMPSSDGFHMERGGEHGPPAFELGVHIADVCNFVPVQSAMDMEARRRGNSIYFPRFVIPMLPEILSNGVCSLQEDQPRLTKSAFIRYDSRGKVVGERFANTLIRSKKRLTYRDAQAVIDDSKGAGKPYTKGLLEAPPNPNVPVVAEPVRRLLLNMDRLATTIRKRRLDDGMIVLDLPEVELVMDAEGRVIDARPEDDSFTHKIIEMFMVEANEAVARFLTRQRLSVLRRVHPDPDTVMSEQVRLFIARAGNRVPRVLDRHVIQELLDSVRGTPIAYAVHLSVLKTFSTAEYSPLELGHYALASENYAHFTSPIRRYADLVIHRAMQSVFDGSAKGGRGERKPDRGADRAHDSAETALAAADVGLGKPPPGEPIHMPPRMGMTNDYTTLVQLGKHLSFTERRAQDAERELRSVKVLQLLAQHIGDTFDGVITGVTSFGIFVQFTRFLIEGLIRISDLPGDYWRFEENSASLRGERTGRQISLGDHAKAQIVSVNVSARRLDLRLLEHGPSSAGQAGLKKFEPGRSPKSGKRSGQSEHRSGERQRGGGGVGHGKKPAVAGNGGGRGKKRRRGPRR